VAVSGRAVEASPAMATRIEAILVELVAGIAPARPGGRGRPPIMPAMLLWASLTIGVLRGVISQVAVWRLVLDTELWRGPRIAVTDEAVYKRLAAAGSSPLGTLFTELTTLLVARIAPWHDEHLVAFATDVVAIDETTLDPVARSLPRLRGVKPGDDAVLPGKIAGILDLRRQLWRRIQLIDAPRQNEKVAARDLVVGLRPGTLILADLGYFGFEWFDDLTDAGFHWISRYRAKTSHRVAHVFYQDDTTFDGLVWLGAHRADRAKHLVRLVRFRTGTTERAYLTNVRSPQLLTPTDITASYARRWDIELAVKLVKRELKLHLLWSAKPAVIRHQVWAVLIIAQILQALRVEIAGRAGVELFDVSMPLLVQYFPRYAAAHDDPIAAYIADGKLLKFIRASRRIVAVGPRIPAEAMSLPPPDLVLIQTPRYAHRNCGSRRLTPN
jgi:hypothetical protein